MEKKLFSIVIPTLNEELFLPKLLKDLVFQKEKSFEVIVVDGNSVDKTEKNAKLFKKEFALCFINGKKRNIAYQRNYGAGLASGTYLVFLDADNRIAPTFLSKLKKEIEKTKNVLFIPRYYSQDKFFQDKTVFDIFNFLIEASQLTAKPFSLGAAMIFERNYFNHLGGFNEKAFLAEDHDIVQRAKKFGVTIKILKNSIVKVSMRRFRREGRFELMRKYFISTLHMLKSGGIEKKLYEYDMGGAHYTSYSKTKTKTMDKEIRNYFQNIKRKIAEFTTG